MKKHYIFTYIFTVNINSMHYGPHYKYSVYTIDDNLAFGMYYLFCLLVKKYYWVWLGRQIFPIYFAFLDFFIFTHFIFFIQ